MVHGGTFQVSPWMPPRPIRGRQVFDIDVPGFVWSGRVRFLPGLWLDATDEWTEGRGRLEVWLDSALPVASASGFQVDKSEAVRFLAEMAWFPTAFFDPRLVRWAPIDDRQACATLSAFEQEVSATFEFGADGLPTEVLAERFDGAGRLHPWRATYRSYRVVDGLKIPFEGDASWEKLDRLETYARWRVESVRFEEPSGAEFAPVRRGCTRERAQPAI
jgi:hypothetical protein